MQRMRPRKLVNGLLTPSLRRIYHAGKETAKRDFFHGGRHKPKCDPMYGLAAALSGANGRLAGLAVELHLSFSRWRNRGATGRVAPGGIRSRKMILVNQGPSQGGNAPRRVIRICTNTAAEP